MEGMIHEYERTVVIRMRYRVESGDRVTAWMRIDSDVPDRDTLLGLLTRAQWEVNLARDEQHDRLQVSGLPPWDPEDEEDGD
ncbi:MAG: hypothetical protein LOD90_05285 [Symbiobacteriaceae bacterium]